LGYIFRLIDRCTWHRQSSVEWTGLLILPVWAEIRTFSRFSGGGWGFGGPERGPDQSTEILRMCAARYGGEVHQAER
jgi:hypothetical protein